jgi:hypothetical protein
MVLGLPGGPVVAALRTPGLSPTSEAIAPLISYSATDWVVSEAEESRVLEHLRTCVDLSATVLDLDAEGLLGTLIERVDEERHRNELVSILTGRVNAKARKAVERHLKRLGIIAREAGVLADFASRVEQTKGQDLGGRPGTAERLAVSGSWDAVVASSEIASMLLGKRYPMSRMFLKHYLTGEGAPLRYTPPDAVQADIRKRFAKPGSYRDISPYSWGNPDIRNGLGHFNLEVVDLGSGRLRYYITDRYVFPDRDEAGKQVEHGFQVGRMTKEQAAERNKQLGRLGEFRRESGAVEQFRLQRAKGEPDYTLLLPQRWLVDHGVDFESLGVFDTDAVPVGRSAKRAGPAP